MSRGLLDTSVVIALAQGESVRIPEEAAISVITVCGLHHGVLIASDDQRSARLATLSMVLDSFDALPVDGRVAPHYGQLVADARRLGWGRPRTADALIAATALAHGIDLYVRDRDFERLDLPNLLIV